MGEPLLDSIVAAVIAKLPAVNDAEPAWRTLPQEARRRGKSTRAFRRWCVAHNVVIREDSHRDAWVSPAAVDRAIEGFDPVPTRASEEDAVDAAIRAARERQPR